MISTTVIYQPHEENGRLVPQWMLLQGEWDWTSSLVLRITAPYQCITMDEIDSDVMSYLVPDDAYILRQEEPLAFGVHLPRVALSINKRSEGRVRPEEVKRLILRIDDIEATMQCCVRTSLQWG